MKPSIRLFKVLTAATCKGTGDPATRPSPDNLHVETVTRWRVMPGDLDLFGHMNNSRYLMLMDFARLDYLARIGLMITAFRRRWIVPVAMTQVDFYRPLKPFQKFEIGTQVLSWNHRWFYMRQTFRTQCPNRIIATAYVKTIFCSRSGQVAPADVVRMALGHDFAAPTMPDHLRVKFGLVGPAANVKAPVAELHAGAVMATSRELAHHTPARSIEELVETLPA
jgi:acyl-CoA thioesterase FadM